MSWILAKASGGFAPPGGNEEAEGGGAATEATTEVAGRAEGTTSRTGGGRGGGGGGGGGGGAADALSSAEGAELADGKAEGEPTVFADAVKAGNAEGAVPALSGLVALGTPISADAVTESSRPAAAIAT